jgi:hypothetical protein
MLDMHLFENSSMEQGNGLRASCLLNVACSLLLVYLP